MSAVLESRTAIRGLVREAEQLVKNRALTTVQKNAKMDKIEAQIKGHNETIRLHESSRRLLSAGDSIDYQGDDLSGSHQLRGLHAGLALEGYAPMAAPQIDIGHEQAKELFEAAVSHKNLSVSTKATDSTSIAPATISDYRLPPVTARREPTRVLSLLPTFATEHPSVTWFSTTGTTAAAAVAEGGTKPTSTIAYAANTGTVTKIAHVAEITDETMSDFPSFLQVLTADMAAGLFKAENDELLNATVTGAHKFPGLLATSGILTLTRTTESNLDAVAEAFDALRVGSSFAEPDGIIIHPATYGIIRRSKDSQNRYYLQPDPTQGWNPSLWGCPVVLSTQCPVGTAVIGSFADSVVVYVRDGLRLETANQGSAQFTSNTTLVRAEERLLLTVPRPSGILKLTGLS
jgi:HK97 family phage major capsid protein